MISQGLGLLEKSNGLTAIPYLQVSEFSLHDYYRAIKHTHTKNREAVLLLLI